MHDFSHRWESRRVHATVEITENPFTKFFSTLFDQIWNGLAADQDERLLDLLTLLREHRLLIDFPITYDEHGVTVRVVSEEHNIQSVFDILPTEVRSELRVERIRDYVPEPYDLRALLSVRQREVLETAVDTGYYAFPRRATIDDLADRLGISRSTASEHLRRIEARVLGALA